MAPADSGQAKRPERVIILDADDPMVEIQGRVVWQEEHDRVVNEVREHAYRQGYDEGYREAQSHPVTITFRQRRSLRGWLRLALLAAFLVGVGGFLVAVLQAWSGS